MSGIINQDWKWFDFRNFTPKLDETETSLLYNAGSGRIGRRRDAPRIFLIKRNKNINSMPPMLTRSLIELHYLIISHFYQYQLASGVPRNPEMS